jgi:2'-5' RNA ligase
MAQDAESCARLNCFALVAYIPDPLGKFLDDLRKELVPRCIPHAHVTILPPRPISGGIEAAAELARSLAAEHAPFEVEPANVAIFPKTEVVYLELGEGADSMRRMHAAMNAGPFEFEEPFAYHPHVTLAQEVAAEQARRIAKTAAARWAAFPYSKRFKVDALTFVQACEGNRWVDLARCPLKDGAVKFRPGEDLYSLVR